MNPQHAIEALEKEKRLLEDFICLSEEQLLLLERGDLQRFDELLDKRTELMNELVGLEYMLARWIVDLHLDPSVDPVLMQQISALNEEIVSMATHVTRIDQQAHARLCQSVEGA